MIPSRWDIGDNMEYFNPSAFKPEIDFKPTGALAGQIWADREGEYGQLMNMFKQSQQMDMQKKQTELNEFLKASPLRSLQDEAKMQQALGTIQTAIPQAQEEQRTRQLGNQLSEGTLRSKIDEAAAKARQEGNKASMAELRSGLQEAAIFADQADQMAPGWRESGLPAPMAAQLNGSKPWHRILLQSGGNAHRALQVLAQTNEDYIREEMSGKLRNEGSEQVALINERSANYTADVNDRMRRYVAEQAKEAKENSIKEDAEMRRLYRLSRDTSKSVAERQAAKEELEFIMARRVYENQARAVVSPGYSSEITGLGKGAIPKPPVVPSVGEQPQGMPTFNTYADFETAVKEGKITVPQNGIRVKIGGQEGTIKPKVK